MKTILPTHFTRINRIIFFLSLLFSALAFVALLNVSPTDDNQSRKLLATLAEEEQYVTRKFSDSLSFSEVNRGDKLYNGDQIFTGDNSRAKIIFLKSKNVLNIPPRGLVKIEEGESGENVEIQKGLAEFVIQKDQVLNIVKGEEKVVLTSTGSGDNIGKIFYKKDKLIVQVNKGAVDLQNKEGKKESVKKDEVVSVSAVEKVITKIVSTMTSSPLPDQKVDI
ncbi:MAG: hypothetical protein K2Q18_19340, partial [Bdellovibrionales bacterium]|nr:hypothetical protein [Bdellovibrionales bacterium]